MSNLMQHNGFKASVMEAERLTGEWEHALPPGSALPIHRVSEFKKHPNNWMEEDGCYVVPVRANKGLWFDWTSNDTLNTAVVPTVKGCNPITGLKTDNLGLERYENKCPKHNIKFIADRYCDKCGYKWPAQNYVTTPNTLWWDGFRADDGSVRQFFITEDMMRDIANHMIGKENTVPAFGFAFFKSKEPRVQPVFELGRSTGVMITISNNGYFGYNPSDVLYGDYTPPVLNFWSSSGNEGPGVIGSSVGVGGDGGAGSGGAGSVGGGAGGGAGGEATICGSSPDNSTFMNTNSVGDIKFSSNANHQLYSQSEIPIISKEQFDAKRTMRGMKLSKQSAPVEKKEVAIGAGAKVKQGLIVDPYELDSWKDEPDSIMRIYFVFQNEFDHWKSFGMKDLDGTHSDGMLKGLPIG